MTTPVNICNVALLEMGSRVYVNSLTNPISAPEIAAATLYQPKITALERGANWDFCRAQLPLTLYKQAVVNGALSLTPPPQPFLFEYLYPPDCIKVRFLLPTVNLQAPGTPITGIPIVAPAPTAIPFVIGNDTDPNGNPIKVILTNLPNAQCIYTRDLSQIPDMWDALFTTAATAYLAAFFINALARNAAQYNEQVAIAKGAIDSARVANANESISSIDHLPDWMRARSTGGYNWAWNQGGGATAAYGAGGGWDQVTFPDGLRY